MQLPSLVRGFLPSEYLSPSPHVSPRLVPLGFVLTVLVPALSFVLFFFLLVRPHRIACFGLGPFLHFLVTGSSLLVPPLLFFSPLGVSCPFLGGFPEVYRSVSSLGGALLLSFLPVFVPPLHLPRFHSVAPFEFFPSVVVGNLPDVLVLCLFVHFGITYRVIWLFLSTLALFLPVLVLLSVLFLGPLSFSFPLGVFSFSSIQGFHLGPVVATHSVFQLLDLVLLYFFFFYSSRFSVILFWSLFRFSSLSVGSECLGGVLSLFVSVIPMLRRRRNLL